MTILANMERNTRVLVLGTLLALVIVSLVTVTHPPDVLWDESNGHRNMVGRSGSTTLLQLLMKIAEAAALVFFLPMMGYIGAALFSVVRKRPFQAARLLWTLWGLSILGWLALGDWRAMGD